MRRFVKPFFILNLIFLSTAVAAGEKAGILGYLEPIPNAEDFLGRLAKYHINGITIHTYESKEGYGDWSFIFETDKELVLLETQPMTASSLDLMRYIQSLNKPLAGIIASYHGVGPESYPGVPIYGSKATIQFISSGQIENIMTDFAIKFPDFDPKVILPTRELDSEYAEIGGLRFRFVYHNMANPMPGVDVGLPEQKIFYLHMLGGDTHAIINSLDEIQPLITYLETLKQEGYDVFLSGHHMPELRDAVDAKIAYLRLVAQVASQVESGEAFLREMRQQAPDKKGDQYLEMTVANLFKN